MNISLEFNIETIIKEYSNYVFKIVDNIVENNLTYSDKEEIVSTVFYLLWKYQKNIKSDIKSYLGVIARNCSYQKLKDSKIDLNFNYEIDLRVDYDYERTMIIKEVLKTLNEKEKKLFDLYYVYGYKINEIAKILKVNKNIIKVRLFRIRKKLKGGFKNEKN